MSQNLSSAAVVIGAFRVNIQRDKGKVGAILLTQWIQWPKINPFVFICNCFIDKNFLFYSLSHFSLPFVFCFYTGHLPRKPNYWA